VVALSFGAGMAVRFFHTSDWHLGQFFYNHSRQYEHQQFLTWLIEQIKDKQPHALLIAGDVFDVINPASSAQKQLYQFLADAHSAAPHMQTLMIAGNHDSGYRLEQVEPLLEKYNAKTVGIVRWNTEHRLDFDRLILPIHNEYQEIVAWCIALPFLRPAEITGHGEATQDSQQAIEYIHQALIKEALQRKTADQALILMSHAHMQGADESKESERPIIIGNHEALSTELFSPEIDYVALGHLHKPQKVQSPHVRYSGSPIPLSFSELNYKHQVLEVNIDPALSENRLEMNPLYIPRTVQLYRLSGELDEVLTQLTLLPTGEISDIDQRDYLDIEYYSLTPPPPDLRKKIEDLLPPERYRLVRISRKYLQQSSSEVHASKIDLAPPTPEQLFEQLWQKMGYSQDEQVKQDFMALLQDAQQSEHKVKTADNT